MKFGIEVEFMIANTYNAYDLLDKIEACGIPMVSVISYNHKTFNKWKIVTDASLSGIGLNGYELVSPPLLYNEESLNEIRKIIGILRKEGATIKACCGFHVHVDASSFSVNEVRTILKRYAQYETIIDSFMPKSRRSNNNSYCQSLRGKAFSGSTIRRFTQKYTKINTETYVKYGTIEFRHHSGTLDDKKIITWIEFIKEFIEKSIKTVPTSRTRKKKLPEVWKKLS